MKFFNHPFLLIAAGIVIVLRLFTTGVTRSSIVFAFLVLFLILKGFVEIAAQHQHKLADVLKIAAILSLNRNCWTYSSVAGFLSGEGTCYSHTSLPPGQWLISLF